MANANDSAILFELMRVEQDPELLISTFEELGPKILDDSTYWQLLLTAWVKNGSVATQDRFRALMQSGRRNRIRAMKRSHLAFWRDLPDPLIAHRWILPDEDVDRALSWTLDPEWVARRYDLRERQRVLVTRSFPKVVVPFFTDRRGEREIVVLDASLGTPLPPGTPTNAAMGRAVSRSPQRR